MIIVVIFFMSIMSIVYYTLIDTSVGPVVNPPGNQAAVANNIAVKPRMPEGYQPEVAVRDPFLAPPEYRAQDNGKSSNQTNNVAAADNVSHTVNDPSHATPKQQDSHPALTGVVGGGGTRVAIISYGGASRSCQVGEYIGPYQLVGVNNNSAALWGPEGRLVLTVGR